MSLYDIAFCIVIFAFSSWLIWELIPDSTKKYWKYILDLRKDAKDGRRRRYSFSWRFDSKK